MTGLPLNPFPHFWKPSSSAVYQPQALRGCCRILPAAEPAQPAQPLHSRLLCTPPSPKEFNYSSSFGCPPGGAGGGEQSGADPVPATKDCSIRIWLRKETPGTVTGSGKSLLWSLTLSTCQTGRFSICINPSAPRLKKRLGMFCFFLEKSHLQSTVLLL